MGTQLRACHALSTPTATSPASQALALPSPAIWQIRLGDHPTQGARHASACLPAFRPSELRSVCTRPARRAAGVARATLSSSGAPAQPASTANAVSCRRPKSRAPGGVRWLGGSSAARGLLTTSMGVVEGRSHPGQRLVVRVRTPRRPRRACWGGGVRGQGPAAALAGQGVGRCRQD